MARAALGQGRRAARSLSPAFEEEPWLRAALDQKEELCLLLESLVESATDGLVALDFRARPVHVSPGLSGRGEGALARLEDSPDPALPRAVLQRLRREARACTPGHPSSFTLEWDRPEIGTTHYQVVAVAGTARKSDELDERVLTLFAFHDRTREANLEAELAQARNLAALGQMAGTVAHELRNPLGAIQGFATLLERDLAGQEGPLRQVDRILRGVESADRIVGDLLEYCRPLHLRLEPIPLAELLQESLSNLRATSRWSDGIRPDLHVEPDLPSCLGDRRHLHQVLENLYGNAIDAMQGNGTIAIRARGCGPAGRPDRLRIVVRDSGCGLTAEEVAQVFAPFYTTKPGGTGLGLALVRRITEAHGGRVHVVSAPGRGTSVVLDLPAAGSAREGADRTESGEEAA
jgi:signal transduction histidine kinase